MLLMIRNFINGLVFGAALIVPGVSGGTFAIILGFYEQLIEAVNHFTKDFRRYAKFLFPFGIGVVFGIVVFASIIQFLLSYHSFSAMMFFIGLIAGVIPSMYKRTGGKPTLIELPLIIIPIIILVLIAHLSGGISAPVYTEINAPFMIFIFVIGIIAAASLLIPGLSGSFVLLIAGIYPLATHAVSSLRLVLGGNLDVLPNIIMILAPLGVGVIIGIFIMARLLEKLLKRYNRAVFLVVIGLMIGSIYALLVDPMLTQSGVNIPIGLVACAVGVILSYKMGSKK